MPEEAMPFMGSNGKGMFMVAAATVITFCTAGVVFGFNRVKSLLIKDGAYSWLCKEGEATPCDDQLYHLETMFAVATVALNMSSLPVGMFMDRFGPKKTSTLGSILHASGLVCLAYSSKHFDGYVAGYTLIGLGGVHMFLSHIDMINIFPKHMGLVNSCLTGAFDASALVPVLWGFFYNYGAHLQTLFLSYLAVSFGNYMFCYFFLGATQIQPPSTEESTDEEMEDLLGDGTGFDGVEGNTIRKVCFYNMYKKTATEQIISWEFALGAFFTSFSMLQLNFMIQTLSDQLGRVYTQEEQAALSYTFDLILPIGGLLSIPFVGFVLDYGSVVSSFASLEFLFILYTVLSLIPVASCQYATFVVFVFARTALYASASDYVGRMFGFQNFGTVYGSMMSVSAVICLLQNPLARSVGTIFHGDYSKIKYIFIVIQTVSAALPIYLYTKNANIQKLNPIPPKRFRKSSVSSFGSGAANVSFE